jgi:hypothetical protein
MVSLQIAKRLVSLKNDVCIGSRHVLSVASASEGASRPCREIFMLLAGIAAGSKAGHGFLSNALMARNPSCSARPSVWPRRSRTASLWRVDAQDESPEP